MSDALLAHEAPIRLIPFLLILAAMAAWEFAAPRRRTEIPRLVRWSNNIGLLAIDTVLVRLAFPLAAVGLAVLAEERGWGLLNQLGTPQWLDFALAILVLDLAIYLQHLLFHAVPALWRVHRTHHSDLEFDVTTGLRFHPLEIGLSMALKLAVVVVLGPPPLAVLVFEVLLNASSMFNHSNIAIPPTVDRVLRMVIVTPDMHRIHHSVDRKEANSNFGFAMAWWDRLFGTYRAEPRLGHEDMPIGVARFRTRRELWLDRMLIQPLHRTRGDLARGSDDRQGDGDGKDPAP